MEEELNKYIKDHFTIDKEQLDRFGLDEKDYIYSMNKSDMLALVEHFANWQKGKDKKWLADNHKQIFNNGYEEGFEAGRDDMSEEMLKDAVECDVIQDGGDLLTTETWDEMSDLLHKIGANNGDKVKLAIVITSSLKKQKTL